MKKVFQILAAVLILKLCVVPATLILRANNVKIHPDAGKTSAAFLKIGAGARAAGMANAFAGISDDATAIYWNPAGLASARPGGFEINASHNEWFESIKHDFVGFSYRKKDSKISFGGAFYGLYTPQDIERRQGGLSEDDPFEPLTPVEGYFGAYDLAASLGFGCRMEKISKGLSVGGSVKIINQTIDDVAGWGAGLDIGAIYQLPGFSPFSFAAVFQNMGTPIKLGRKSYPLPFVVRTALSYKKKISPAGRPLNLSFETAFPIDNYPFFYLGGEYFITKIFALRTGYRYRLYGLELGDISGFSAGTGMRFSVGKNYEITLDYAFSPYGVLGNSHRISAGVKFGPTDGNLHENRSRAAELKKQQDENISAPRSVKAPTLPTPTSLDGRSGANLPDDIVFQRTNITFTPKIVSNISSVIEFKATPVSDEHKKLFSSFNGILKTRAVPSEKQINNSHLFEIAHRYNKSGKSLELFFKNGFGGRVENFSAVIALPSDKKIKAVYPRPVGGADNNLKNNSALYWKPAPKSSDGRINYYEIKSPELRDIIIEISD